MNTNILCEKEERTALANLYEGMTVLLQDSDDEKEKEKIKKALQGMNENTSYIVLGEAGSGKTGILRALFQDIFTAESDQSGDICEYRWGEQEFCSPVVDGYQKKFMTNGNLRGLSIIDTKGLNRISPDSFEKIKRLAEGASAILVSLDAQHVNSTRLWDLIENIPSKRMVFFLTKCDLLQAQELETARERLECYMRESNISAPIFPVCLVEGAADIPGMVSLGKVRLFVKEHLIGFSPTLNRQWENVEKGKQLLMELKQSFALRKKQYISDAEILQKINCAMDGYVENHKETLAKLIKKLEKEVNTEIDNYEKEIISKIDPYKIKERFRSREDFADYLNMVNANYKDSMTDSVNRKTIEFMKESLHDLEKVFKEAIGYFNTRENILEMNDRFYGTLSRSRNEMSAETREVVISAGELYKTLSEASDELFLQVWNARERYDTAIRRRRADALSVGGLAGGGTALGTALAIQASAATAAATTSTTASTVLALVGTLGSGVAVAALVGIGVILGAVLINQMAKTLFDPRAAAKMEETTQKCIEQFKSEVDNTRKIMIKQITSQVTEIYEKELASVDRCFLEFRMSVNIDARKLPFLEQRLQETERLLQYIESYNRM